MKTFLLNPERSCWLRYFFSVLFLTFFSANQVFAQDVKQEWARQYGHSVALSELNLRTVFDEEGNVYIAGTSLNSSNLKHIVVVKYTPEGEQVWVRSFGAGTHDELRDIAVSKAGEVVVMGESVNFESRSTLLLLTIDSETGQIIWVKQINSATHTYPISMQLDNVGGIYAYKRVIDMRTAPHSYTSLTKYSTADGAALWGKSFTTSSFFASFSGLAFDDKGDVYITGEKNIPTGTNDTYFVKFDGTEGTVVWEQSYASIGLDRITGFVANSTEGVFITGHKDGEAGVMLVHYAATDGEKLWSKTIVTDGVPVTQTSNLLFDMSGRLYSSGTVGGSNYLIRYHTETGDIMWRAPFAGTIHTLLTDNAGSLYATEVGTGSDYLVAKYDAETGNLLWQIQSEDDNYRDVITDVKVSSSEIYIIGQSTDSEGKEALFVAKHQAADGAQEWKVRQGRLYADDEPESIATDQNGNSYVIANSIVNSIINTALILKYTASGELAWVKNITDRKLTAIALDQEGSVFVTGHSLAADTIYTMRLSQADGAIAWVKKYDGRYKTDRAFGITTNSNGEVYVTGESQDRISTGLITLKYSGATGEEIWRSRMVQPEIVGYPERINYVGKAIALDEAGGVYISGTRSGRHDDFLVVKLNDADGQVVWASSAGTREQLFETANDIVTDNSGGIYVVGGGYDSFTTIKYGAASDSAQWYSRYEGQLPALGLGSANAVTYAPGGVYVTGFVENEGSSTEMVTIKYDPENGEQLWLNHEDEGYGLEIEVDALGGVYVLSQDFTTVKYNATDGSQVWSVKPEISTVRATAMALDDDLNIFVTGTTSSQETGLDILTIKYSQQGDLPCFSPLSVQLSLPPHAVRVGEQVRTTADFGDYVPGEAHNIRWMWGDQSQPSIAYFAAGDSHVTGEHIYTQAGIYKVGLDFSESCLESADENYKQWMVIYDPAAGSVTGGGQLLSLQTSLPWMNQQQNAQFSFNVSYNQNRDTAPQGQTQLNLRQQGVFRSNTIDWLVVRGDQALWQGTGTLNGEGNYGFTASVWDGRGTGANDAGDEIRIRIWDKNAGNALVYDNFETAGDIYDMTNPTSRIVRGQIIIHPINAANITASQQATLYNYPNTFTDKTIITFTAEKAGNYTLGVYDMRGKLVQQLWQGQAKEGQNYSIELDGTSWPKGIYVARLVSKTGSQSIKMLLEK